MPRRKKVTEPVQSRPCGHSGTEEDELHDPEIFSRANSKIPKPRAKQHCVRKRLVESPDESLSEECFPEARARHAGNKGTKQKYAREYPRTGIRCKRHKRVEAECLDSTFASIKTLYSQFPKDRFRLLTLNVASTIVFYLILYPFVNFFWLYFVNIDDEVASMFHYITDEPTYAAGWRQHFNKLNWLAFPRFTAESLSLLLATTIKDTIILHFEGFLEDVSLTNFVGGNLPKRYR